MEVPIETEIKHPIRNRPATAKCAGINDNPKLTVLSTPPAAVTAPEKPPAQRKIRLIVMMFSSPTPLAITSIFLLKLNSLFCKNATKQCDQKRNDRRHRIKILEHNSCARKMIKNTPIGSSAIALPFFSFSIKSSCSYHFYFYPHFLSSDWQLPPDLYTYKRQ